MEYFLLEIRQNFQIDKKDTERKRKLYINKWIKELQYIVDSIRPQLENKQYTDRWGVYAMHLGLKYRSIELNRYEAELQYLKDNISVLCLL